MNDALLLLGGAALALLGGIIGDEYRSWRDRSGERKSIKVSLVDELQDIESTLGKMHQVWEKTTTLYPTDITDLQSCNSAYTTHRQRLFLIQDVKLRKEVHVFYKTVSDMIRKTDGKVGTLADTEEAKNEQRGFHDEFQKIAADAKNLREKLEK